MKKSDKLSWGVTLLFFGIMFLLRIWGNAPHGLAQYAFDVRNFPIAAGVIFLIFHDTRAIGIAMLILGVFMRFDLIMKTTNQLSPYVWPIVLIIIGGVMIWGFKKGK